MSPVYPIGEPTPYLECFPTLSSLHHDAIGSEANRWSLLGGGSFNSAAWYAASLAVYVPFRLFAPTIFDRMFTYNGGTAGNSLDLGVYDSSLIRRASMGLAVQSGTNGLQIRTFGADLVLGPGRYFMALSMNGTTGTFFVNTTSPPVAGVYRCMGLFEQSLSGESTPGTLPATAAVTAYARTTFPWFGLVRKGFTI